MSITYNTNISLAVQINDAIVNENNNEVVLIEATSSPPTLRHYDLTSGTQNGSNVNLAASMNGGLCMIDSASALCCSFTVTTVDLVELSSGYRTNHSGSTTVPTTRKGQQIDADKTNKIAFIASNTVGTLNKFDGTTETASNSTPLWLASAKITTVLNIAANRFILGTNTGQIVEINNSLTVAKIYDIPAVPSSGFNSSIETPIVSGLSYDNNLLCVTTVQGYIYVFDHSTETLISHQKIGTSSSTTTNGATLCKASSGITLYGYEYTPGTSLNVVNEVDFTIGGLQVRDVLFMDSGTKIVAVGINDTNGKAFAVQGSGTSHNVRLFSIIPRSTTTRTFTIQYPSGTDVKADLILLDDTNNEVLLDTYIQSPGTYRVATGKAYLEIVKYGEGETAVFEMNSWSS